MITLYVASKEYYDDSIGEFVYVDGTAIRFEYSLLAIKRWEEKYKKCCHANGEKTNEELLYLFQCMALDDFNANQLTLIEANKLIEYIQSSPTATNAYLAPSKKKKPIKIHQWTAEVYYAVMCNLGIDWDAQHWHINQLIQLITTIQVMNSDDKDVADVNSQSRMNAILIMERREKYKTKG